MTVSLYQVSVPVFLQGLKALRAILVKADAHVTAKGLDANALLDARLFPDMFKLSRQVQLVTDFAKGAVGRLAGADLPAYEDTEVSFADLVARLDKTIAYVEGFTPAQIDGQEDREITLIRRGETMTFKAQPYLLEQALPNYFFHLATAYNLLRHNGVEIGKKDFLGTV